MAAQLDPRVGHSHTVTDPVCGAVVDAQSIFRHKNGSRYFSFCSSVCLDRFVADPLRFSWEQSDGTETTIILPRDDDAAHPGRTQRVPSASAGAAASARTPGLFSRLFPLRERRFARAVSRAMMTLYHAVKASEPELSGRPLYRRLVMERLKLNGEAADVLLRRAQDSFAMWPEPRDITFSDVVHMVAITEYHASHGEAHWIVADIGRVVAAEIDHSL